MILEFCIDTVVSGQVKSSQANFRNLIILSNGKLFIYDIQDSQTLIRYLNILSCAHGGFNGGWQEGPYRGCQLARSLFCIQRVQRVGHYKSRRPRRHSNGESRCSHTCGGGAGQRLGEGQITCWGRKDPTGCPRSPTCRGAWWRATSRCARPAGTSTPHDHGPRIGEEKGDLTASLGVQRCEEPIMIASLTHLYMSNRP